MDPLSDVLSLLKPRSYMAGGFDAGGDWSLQFQKHEGIKCYAVVSGQCWLAVQGVAEPVLLKAGECFLLPRGLPFRLASDLSLPPQDALELLRRRREAGVGVINGGGDCMLVGGHFVFNGRHTSILLEALPPISHVHKESDRESLRWSLEKLVQELKERRPGCVLIAQHMAHMMLVQALRLVLAEEESNGVGWLYALADPQIGGAIGALHSDPAQRWTLETLAQHVGMSRSTLALKFKQTVGASPMEYLTRWRMLLAGDRLVHSSQPVSVIAQALGYESDSAFSTAFKRVMGCSPRQYVRDQAAA
ncbi:MULTISPECIES: AraC family transcriptional regulator [Duganella]|jgi:AraC-like DNA-binding protein|uniref:AraC family transcriptional regulator n=2 Tax=Duganella TaxID=75654 RepID=A0ABX6MFB2_9BURK|nr:MULTISPECIES: AraC family transcriptional regulator [Duganella]MYN28145.1 AraC family transcriptional regulator [Duganella levis]QJD91607.1 AraC family transcriptional regulator [Duganella dendranthematis]